MSASTRAGLDADRARLAPNNTNRSAVAVMYAGLATTVVATFFLYVDHGTSNTLAAHIRAGYPTYSQARIDRAATTYLVYLSVVGALGVVGWLWTIHAVKHAKPSAPIAATALFSVGTIVAVLDLLIKDTSGETGLPHSLGLIGLLPCVPGLLAVTMSWRRP